MPILTKHQIVRITDVMMQAFGASAGHAGIVADHLANANLAGYDSHGFIRIPWYPVSYTQLTLPTIYSV